MIEIMMALGPFRFSVNTAAYQSLRRASQYRWPAQERIGRAPARQFVGVGGETITLEGAIYPYADEPLLDQLVNGHVASGADQLDLLRELASEGKPLLLTDGRGKVWGQWCVESVDETQTVFFANGSPRKIEFNLSISSYGEDL